MEELNMLTQKCSVLNCHIVYQKKTKQKNSAGTPPAVIRAVLSRSMAAFVVGIYEFLLW